MFQNLHKRPEIRKVTVTVRKPADSSTKPPRQPSPLNPPKSSSSSKHTSPAPRRKQSSSSLQVPSRRRSPPASARTPRPSAPVKRKAQQVNLFDSSSDEDDSSRAGSSEPPLSAKRPKPSPALEDINDPNRDIFRFNKWTKDDEKQWPMTTGAQLTDQVYATRFTYQAVFETDSKPATVELRYPSNCEPERFTLVAPTERGEYAPLEDIVETIIHVCQAYLPESKSRPLLDDITGFERRLKRAIRDSSLDLFKGVIEEYNDTITKALTDGTIASHLENVRSLSLSLVERILSQIYSRTVSPNVNILKQYENGTDNVYGELLPPFSHMIFRETNLHQDQVFVDLGSGVGNVVMQAALEVGCECWGIEQMPNPASLAAKQLTEFQGRCKRWSIVPGDVHLIQGDFLANPEIDAALRKADVILINNQAFTPELNMNTVMKLLDVKEGAKIVSLKSFVPDGWEIKMRNAEDPRNLLKVVKKEYFSKRVSWTDGGGTYFIATKDSSRLRKFMRRGR
jgi:[histone H3]-lysine79 N-trimethyltransferase